MLARGINVIAHLVAQRTVNGELQLSLGSNPDVTADLLPLIAQARRAGQDIVMVGETHAQMPFMGERRSSLREQFDFIVDHPRYDYDLFAPPNPPLASAEHAIGLYASALVRDGGTLQVGIGEMGDALIYALLLRHQQNAAWRGALETLGVGAAAPLIEATGGSTPFTRGLFAASEMFVDQLLELYRAGVLRRRAYDCLALERVLAAGQAERFDASILSALVAAGVGPTLSEVQFAELKHHGVFREDVEFKAGRLRVRGGEWISADLTDAASCARLAAECLGRELRNGRVLHAGFFLGPRGFYAALREMPESERSQFSMRGVGYVNQLYGTDQELRVLQRRAARCINTTMMVTLLGAAVSDALADGAGGERCRRPVQLRRHGACAAGGALDPVPARHPHARRTHHLEHHLALRPRDDSASPARHRDYRIRHRRPACRHRRGGHRGAAERRGLALPGALLAQAKAAGKIRADYTIPEGFRHNLPERVAGALRAARARGFFSEYPFGTDLTTEEIVLTRALKHLAAHTASASARARALLCALRHGAPQAQHQAALTPRMGLRRRPAALASGCSSAWSAGRSTASAPRTP